MKIRGLAAAVFFATCGAAFAANNVGRTYRVESQFPLSANGTLVLENAVGDIEIVGADMAGVAVDVLKTIVAKEEAGLEEGRHLTELVVGGNEETRMLRTQLGKGPRTKEWASTVFWRVRVAKTASVRVTSTTSNRIRVANMRGNVFVKNFNGTVAVENNTGYVTVDSVNGSIAFTSPTINAETRLKTVNGNINAYVRPDADLRWIAESIAGDIRSNLPVRGMFSGPTFRGSVNAPGGQILSTVSLMGTVQLLGAGVRQRAESLRGLDRPRIQIPPEQQNYVVGGLRRATVDGSITYTGLGDVVINEVRGGAQLSTDAGKVQLGSVTGDATVNSRGGSLQLGEILGALKASTRAGDIFVEAARRGGTIETTGGTIRLLYTGGPTRLVSGGGDVVVRQAVGPIDAETRSGDILIAMDRSAKKQKIDAKTDKGNILLNLPTSFAADIDVTIITTDPIAHTVHSDFPGLSVSNEQFDGKTRIRATGKINGGGERVTLHATGGSIRIVSAPLGPALLGR